MKRPCSCVLGALIAVTWEMGGRAFCQKGQPPDTTVTALFRAAQKDAASGKLEQAAEEYKHVLRLDPDLIEARVNLGLTYHSLGQYKLAIEELEKALHQRPDRVGANLFLGIDYLKAGLPDRG